MRLFFFSIAIPPRTCVGIGRHSSPTKTWLLHKKEDILRLIFTIRSKRSRFEAHLQKTVKKSKKEQILRPIYKNGQGVDFEAHLKKRGSYLK